MLGLTINTDIMMIAAGTSDKATKDPKLQDCCLELLEWLRSTKDAAIVVDTEKSIEREYRDKMGDGGYGLQYVKEMAKKFKVEEVVRVKGKAWKVARQRIGPHQGDDNFLRSAMASKDKIFVAEEAHLISAASRVKRHTNVELLSAVDAVARTVSS